ncbi:MAG: flagellar motor protein MotB [Betaproteobacteria bacterium]
MSFKILVAAAGAAAMMTACVTEKKYDAEVGKANTYQQLSTQLQGEVAADQVQIQQLQNLVKLTLANAILFAEGGTELNAAGRATLAKVAPVFKTLTGQKIEVRGFTDNVPIGPELRQRYPTNLALSKARADAVVAFLTAQGVPAGLMVAIGMGETQPVASNDTAAGRAKNRRVEIDIVEAK